MLSLFTRPARPRRRPIRPLPERLEARECPSGGLPDTTFNGTGALISDQSSIAVATAIQADGKMVVAGLAAKSGTIGSLTQIIRLNPDGSPDTSFGGARSGGVVTLDIGANGTYTRAVALQPDGKVLVSGTAFTSKWSSSESEYFVTRLNANGTVDTAFAKKGLFEWNPRTGREDATQLIVLADGSILVGGHADSGGFTAFKLNAAGARVTSFAGGEFRYDFGGRGGGTSGMALAPNGDIILVGGTHSGSVNGPDAGAILALTPAGQLDPGFHGTGTLEVLPAGYVTLGFGDVAIQGSTLIVTGTYTNSIASDDPDGFVPNHGIVSRYSLAGNLDTTFGSGGSFTSDVWGPSVAVAAEGSLVIAGGHTVLITDSSGNRVHDANGNLVSRTETAIAHLTADGTIDTTFGTLGTGFVYLTLGSDNTQMVGLVLGPGGSILVYGSTYTASGQRKASLARLTAP
jgi:uncharacterized delta-60 repeat protein